MVVTPSIGYFLLIAMVYTSKCKNLNYGGLIIKRDVEAESLDVEAESNIELTVCNLICK